MHLAKPCPCAGAFYLLLAIYTQSPAFQQLLFMLLADLPRQSTLVFLIRLKSLRQSNLQPCCSYLLLKFNIWNIQGRRTGFCQAEKVPCLCVTQTLTLRREWGWENELLLCCAPQSITAKWRYYTHRIRIQLTAKPLVALFTFFCWLWYFHFTQKTLPWTSCFFLGFCAFSFVPSPLMTCNLCSALPFPISCFPGKTKGMTDKFTLNYEEFGRFQSDSKNRFQPIPNNSCPRLWKHPINTN